MLHCNQRNQASNKLRCPSLGNIIEQDTSISKMSDFNVRRLEAGHARIRNVPIAVTPEGFWCCPSPAAIQKTLKSQALQEKLRSCPPTPSFAPSPKPSTQKKPTTVQPRSRTSLDDQKCGPSDSSALSQSTAPGVTATANTENAPRKISVGFGQLETSDLKLVLSGKEGISVRMSVHKNILIEHSSFFANKFTKQSPVSSIEIGECEDVEIYVETIGLMYCKEMKQRLIKQSVSRVLRILKLAESLGFLSCINSCLEYLEAVPWIGEEEENVVSLARRLQNNNFGVSPLLRRVSSDIPNPPNDTLAQIMGLVLKSNEDRSRREMKSMVLKLLQENSFVTNGSVDTYVDLLYSSGQNSLAVLLFLFKQAADPGFSGIPPEDRDLIFRRVTLESDNLLWLVELMAGRHVADKFAVMWASQDELATLHPKLPIVSRHLVSCITARLFVGIGRGEMLPSKETRQMLLQVWLQPLIEDFSWLQHACRSFDQKVVEEGIGRTILTLPLEDQQCILLSWLGSFLKVGDKCPNLQRAFEVWWRRTFIRPYVDQHGNATQIDKPSG